MMAAPSQLAQGEAIEAPNACLRTPAIGGRLKAD